MKHHVCPECGSYRIIPHCSDPACQEQWCSRAQCAWSSGEGCGRHDLKAPEPYPENLAYARGFYQPVLKIGSINPNRWGKMEFDSRWQWDESSGLPRMEANEVLAFVGTVRAAIQSLQGPQTW